MKIKSLIFAIVASIVFSACSSPSDTRSIKNSEPKIEAASYEDCVSQIESACEAQWGDACAVENDDAGVVVKIWQNDLSMNIAAARLGNEDTRKAWMAFTKEFLSLSVKMQDVFSRNNLTGSATIRIVNPDDHADVYYEAADGNTVYDPVSGIDQRPETLQKIEKMKAELSTMIDDAVISVSYGGGKTTYIAKSGFSPEKKPDNWDDICAAVLAAYLTLDNRSQISFRIEGENDDILATIGNDKVMYDVYARAEEREKESARLEAERSTSYYVLNTNTKKFHLPNCSSVENIDPKNSKITNKTRQEVIAMGYSPCGKCKP